MYKNFITREQVAVLLYRTINYLKNGDETQSTSLLSAADQEVSILADDMRTLRATLSKWNNENELSNEILTKLDNVNKSSS
jgi:hypothetical protein